MVKVLTGVMEKAKYKIRSKFGFENPSQIIFPPKFSKDLNQNWVISFSNHSMLGTRN